MIERLNAQSKDLTPQQEVAIDQGVRTPFDYEASYSRPSSQRKKGGTLVRPRRGRGSFMPPDSDLDPYWGDMRDFVPLSDEQKEINRVGLAAARAALRGEPDSEMNIETSGELVDESDNQQELPFSE